MILSNKGIIKALIRLRGCAGWSAPLLFANPQRQVFSQRGPYKMDWKAKSIATFYSGMRKFRIDQDFLIGHWHMIYTMPVVFAEIHF